MTQQELDKEVSKLLVQYCKDNNCGINSVTFENVGWIEGNVHFASLLTQVASNTKNTHNE